MVALSEQSEGTELGLHVAAIRKSPPPVDRARGRPAIFLLAFSVFGSIEIDVRG